MINIQINSAYSMVKGLIFINKKKLESKSKNNNFTF